ncbi:MAG: bifunctional riboflavin kinase/FAD synthetase [Gammaproteobacteria bacterium]
MELIRGVPNIRPRHHGCVASVGNFDGVHLGHQAVLRQLLDASARHQIPSTAIIFEPQPAEYFHPAGHAPRLTAVREKLMLFQQFGIDRVCVMRFNEHFATQSAEEFAASTLVDGFGIRELIIGDDFKFGSARGGDFFALQEFGKRYGFTVLRTHSHILNGERVSSTAVRQKLIDGNFVGAEAFLGRRYFIAGRVMHGQHRGREIGFPTVNLNLNRRRAPLNGIYASYVRGLGNVLLPSVSYVGSRPVIEDPTYLLETHIFDFDEDCYGRQLLVEFVEKVRGDLPFESFEKLREQIVIDCAAARKILGLKPERKHVDDA